MEGTALYLIGAFARSCPDFMTGAGKSHHQEHIVGQAQHFCNVPKSQWHGRANCNVPISWQAQRFREVKCRFRGRSSAFARSSAVSVAGAALSQGLVRVPWQARHL